MSNYTVPLNGGNVLRWKIKKLIGEPKSHQNTDNTILNLHKDKIATLAKKILDKHKDAELINTPINTPNHTYKKLDIRV